MSAAKPVAPRIVASRPRGRVLLVPALVLLALVATWLAAGLPRFGLPFFYSVLVAGIVRVAVGLDGETLVPRRLFIGLATVLGVASVVWLFGLRDGGRGATIVGMLCVVAAFQSLLLLGSLEGTRAYIVILVTSVHAVGTAFLRKDLEALLLVMAYVVVLLWTLLLYERRHALERPPPRTATVRRVRRLHKRPLPFGVGLRTLAALVLIGFPIAVLVIAVVPPVSAVRGAYDFTASEEREREGGAFDSRPDRSGWITGPPRNTSHVEYGSEAPIKESHVLFCEVSETGTGQAPMGVYLRDTVADQYSANGNWDATKTLTARGARTLKPALDGWMSIPSEQVPGGTLRELSIYLHRAPWERWYLQPTALRARLKREGRIVRDCRLGYDGDEKLTYSEPGRAGPYLRPGDIIEEVCIIPTRDPLVLRGRRSDAGVSPLATYLQLPQTTRDAVTPVAERMCKGVTDPWDRALVMERSLKEIPFEYTLGVVGFEGPDNMADFFQRTRKGHCGRYATALVTLLRSMGHPARYVRGFWGGEEQRTRGTVLFRMRHYHAWAELYLHGVGWVPLNPTPPDRGATDAQVGEHALDDGESGAETGEDQTAPVPPPLRFDREAYDQFWEGVGRFLDTVIAQPARWLFGPRTGFAGVWLLLILAAAAIWRGRRGELVRKVAGSDGRLPKGPYGRALLLLAKKGFHRRPHQTPRELLEAVAMLKPGARESLEVITRGFEESRYAGRPAATERVEVRRAIDRLSTALNAKS